MTYLTRFGLFAAVFAMQVAWCTASAPAALEMAAGLRTVVQNAPVSECSTKAQAALNANLQNAFETAPGVGIWLAYGPYDAAGHASAAAAIHCFPVDTGYVVTFTCSVEIPPSLFSAAQLCTAIWTSFSGKTATPLATPTPIPTGCSTTNLVGKWKLDGSSSVFDFDPNGGFTDDQGVSGNWALNGTKATLIYYGTETATLSADGKHLSGAPRSFTREC